MRRRPRLGLTLAPLLLLVLGLQGSASPSLPPGFLAQVEWRGEGPLFGGFSSIAVTQGGQAFLSLSDHGAFVQGRLIRDGDGHLIGVEGAPPMPLAGSDGAPLRPGRTDSEGLALASDGSFYVSFEGPARLRHYARAGAPSENLSSPQDFNGFAHNTALESLCRAPDGGIFTLPEESPHPGMPFPVFRWQDGHWTRFGTLPRAEEFRAVDCAFDDKGHFYLLERAFYGIAGFASRLTRYDRGAEGFTHGQEVMRSDIGSFDNLEGLSIWRDGLGRLRATMIADNNFSAFFITQIVEFALPD